MKKYIKKTPFGYKSSKELFGLYLEEKFERLSNGTIREYYDFIFAGGALRDWIKREKILTKKQFEDKFFNNFYFSIFHSLYNNAKHFFLEDKGQEYYVVLDGEIIGETNEQGEVIISNNTIIFGDHYLVDRVFGESGGSKLFCRVKCKNTGEEKNIYLYEICRQVYNGYKEMIAI